MRFPAILVAIVALIPFAFAQPAGNKQLVKFQAAYSSAKKALAAKPKDKKVRAAFVVAADRYATSMMVESTLAPRLRYPGALRLYREVLKVDPKNPEALNNSKMIIDVYKSMGRPVPK
jgi:tetratricopeptide (TPR) repeat protein